eukprot:CFRG7332T1
MSVYLHQKNTSSSHHVHNKPQRPLSLQRNGVLTRHSVFHRSLDSPSFQLNVKPTILRRPVQSQQQQQQQIPQIVHSQQYLRQTTESAPTPQSSASSRSVSQNTTPIITPTVRVNFLNKTPSRKNSGTSCELRALADGKKSNDPARTSRQLRDVSGTDINEKGFVPAIVADTDIIRKTGTDQSNVYPTPHNSTSSKSSQPTDLLPVSDVQTVSNNYYSHRVTERGGCGYHIRGVLAPRRRPCLYTLPLELISNCNTLSADEYSEKDSLFNITDSAIECMIEVVRRDWDGQNQYPDSQLTLFLRNICVRMKLDTHCLITTLVYLHRLKVRYPSSRHSSCARRVMFMALLVASKFNHDRPYDNKAWAIVSNFPLGQVNAMERQFLDSLEYVLYVRNKDIDETMAGLALDTDFTSVHTTANLSEVGIDGQVLPPPSERTKQWLFDVILIAKKNIYGECDVSTKVI